MGRLDIKMLLKGALFLGGLYLWGDIAPYFFYIMLPPGDSLPHLGFLLILIVWISFLLRSAFFALVRQRLKPLWLSAALAWLIPVVALMIVSCIEGSRELGFPFPVDAGGYEEPWTACRRGLLPQMAAMLCALAAACIANRVVKRPSTKIAKCGILSIFCLLCAQSTYWARDRFEYSWSTWTPEEMIYDVFVWGAGYLAFWLCVGLLLARRITAALLALQCFEKEQNS